MTNRARAVLRLVTLKFMLMASFSVLVSVSVLAASPDDRMGGERKIVVILNDGRRESFPMASVARIEFKDGPTLIFKDGHQQSFAAADVARFEFSSGENEPRLGRNHFLGKWEVGQGNGTNFIITLEPDGQARKTIGASHGTWVVVDNEARIAWDDGWHDAIRKAGSKHEKRAFAPGKSFSDEPENVTDARNTTAQPI
jgi:hypothetical protein